MSADMLLSRLDGVRQTGAGRHIARCPAHEDRHASLSIRELDDGRTLVHCFAECSTDDVLAAVGLEFDALFPERPIIDRAKRERRPFNAHDILACLETEVLIVAVAAGNIGQGVELTDEDRARVMTAAARIGAAAALAYGR